MSLATALVLGAVALAADPSGGHAPMGLRVPPIGAESGITLRQTTLLAAGGTVSATTPEVRARRGPLTVLLSVPLVRYPTPAGRVSGLGNLALTALVERPLGTAAQAFGVHLVAPLSDPAWTWLHDPREVWPSAGLGVSWTLRMEVAESTLLLRLGGWAAVTRGIWPLPETLPTVQVAAVWDRPLPLASLGVVVEGVLEHRSTSPVDAAALLRWDPLPGVRTRLGAVLPLGVWAGLGPGGPGLDEVTLVVDAGASF